MRSFLLISIFLPLFMAVFTLFSCTARIDGNITANGSAVMTVSMSLGQRMTALIRSIAVAGGQPSAEQEPVQILDSQSIVRSMVHAPGIDSVTLTNTSPSAIEGQMRISQINIFLTSADGKGFITFEQARSGGKCEVSINHENSPAILGHLSKDICDYLNALMAPIATGEKMSKDEYLELVGSFYNKPLSDEIASSRIRVSVEFPGAVTSAKGGTFSGRRANFDIPLLDLLVLETPVTFEVNWRN
jgi:hypothetical protein